MKQAFMTTNGKLRQVKNLGALHARIRKTRPGVPYSMRNPATGETSSMKAYAHATFTRNGTEWRLVVCGAGPGVTWRYETPYASLAVFQELERPLLERHGVSVDIIGA